MLGGDTVKDMQAQQALSWSRCRITDNPCCLMHLGTPSCFLSLLIVIFRNLPAGAPRLLLSVCTGLQLLDMPEQVLKHISRSISARRWANGPARTCCTLNRLSLPVIKVRSVNIHMIEKWLTRPGSNPYMINEATRRSLSQCGDVLVQVYIQTPFVSWQCCMLSPVVLRSCHVLLPLPDTCSEGSIWPQVRHSKDPSPDTTLSELFTWIGRRMKDTVHLAIHIDYPLWERHRTSCTPEEFAEAPLWRRP